MKLNRFFALVLTLCMLFSLAQFPVSAKEIYFEASGEIFTYANAVYSDASASGVDDEGYTVYAVSLPTNPTFSQSEYYAKSLTSYQKPIYRAVMDAFCGISANSLTLKQKVEISYTTEYTTTITSQEQFNTFVNNKLNEEAQKLDLQTLYDAVQYDHTELFWMQGVYGGTAVGASYDGTVATLYWIVSISADSSELFASDSALRTAATGMNTVVNSIISNTPTTNEYDKLVYFNKWLKENNTYNNTHLQMRNYPLAHTAYSAFTSNNDEPTGPVCQGYAYALKYLCDKVGIHSVIVTGDLYQTGSAPGPHAWNAVELEGDWYAIDTTANDALSTDTYNFLAGSSTPSHDPGYPTFSSSHVNDTTHNYPTLSTTAYEPSVVCTHSYDNDCDTTCNECGAKRTVQHVYDNTCDKNCNRCGEIRVIVHTYDDDTDTVCNVCGEQREPSTPASSFEYEINNNKVTIKQYIGTETDVIIPKTIEGYPVTEIGMAFYENASVKSVKLPEGLETIANYAFFRCYGITEMIIPDSVKIIGTHAFAFCNSLKTLDLGEGVHTIKTTAFYDCVALESLTFPSSLTTIEYRAFSGCKALTEITIPATITSLDTDMFTHCTGLKSVVIEEGVTTIPEYTFYNCNQLTTVTLPASVATVERAAFHSCTSITTVHFAGSKADRDSMSIGQWNDAFINATWRYDGAGNDDDDDVVEGCSHTYDNDCDTICNECGATRTKIVGTKVAGLDSSNVLLSYPYQRYDNDLSTMFDGNTAAVDGNGMQLNWSASATMKTIVISLDEPTDLTGLNIFWGNNDWNAVPAQTYKIYLAREGEDTSDSPAVYSFSNDLTNQDGVLRDDFITFSEVEENVVEIHIKVSAHYKKGDLAIRELEILEATYVPVQEPEHKYSNKCDAECNVCGAIREVPDHIYDTNCDADCNECGEKREVSDHIYDNDCDTICNECGATRTKIVGTKVAGLTHSNVSLSYPYQRYGNDLSTMFDGDTTAVDGNGMQLNWSASTDLKSIQITLNEVTDLSGMNIYWGNNDWNAVPAQTYYIFLAGEDGVMGSSAVYEYHNSLTNQDGVLRDDFITFSEVQKDVKQITIMVVAHYKKGDLAIRELEILEATYVPVQEPEHKYSNKCDADCNECGAIREVPDHIYDNAYDPDCNECGFEREVVIVRLPGDVNGDGFVNNKDFGILRQYLNNWDVVINESNADVTGDGNVNNKDMGILRQYLNGWDVVLK